MAHHPAALLAPGRPLLSCTPFEELSINYNGDPNDRAPPCFEVVDQH